MNISSLLQTFFIGICFIIPTFIQAEVIRNFDVTILLDQKGDATITETIIYDFEENSRRGIFREIPTNFRAQGNVGSLDITFLEVTDENGLDRPYVDESGWSVAKIRIGDPEVFHTGAHTYVITYEAKNVMGFFDDIDEFYWNVTGDNWQVPIETYSVRLVHPDGLKKVPDMYSYCGSYGSEKACFWGGSETVSELNLSSRERLDVSEGVTLDVEYPAGTFTPPTLDQKILAYLEVFWGLLLVPFVVRFFLRKKLQAWKRRRNFYRKNPVGVEYDPGDISLIEASYFHDGKFEMSNVGAFLVWAAIHGYIKIEEVKKKTYTFTIIREINPGSELTITQANILRLMEKLSPIGSNENETINLINKVFSKDSEGLMDSINKVADRSATKRTLFKRNKDYLTETYKVLAAQGIFHTSKKVSVVKPPIGGGQAFATAFIFIFLAFNPGIFLWVLYMPLGMFFSASMIVSAITEVLLRKVRYYSEKGLEKERFIKGLYKYIDMAEKDRMNTLNYKSPTPELYEKLLPFAMIFGLEKKWTKQFEDLAGYNPDWYQSQAGNSFSIIDVTNSMTAIGNVLSTTGVPRSSSSGSGGGGFSGGGGGGGGGGSW